MRKPLYSLLTNDEVFSALMPKVYQRGAVEDSPQKPFAVIAIIDSPRLFSSMPRVPQVELWCYDNRGDYGRIDLALERADFLLAEVAQYVVDGETLVATESIGWSGDLYDDVYGANARKATYRVRGRG